MTEALRSTSPHRRHASLVTEGCEARRKVRPSGSRTSSAGERKDAMGHMVNPCKPRAVERANAADRLGPTGSVERRSRSGVGSSTGQTSTGAEGDPTASACPPDGTR
jgi:hypothetical protein